MPRQYWQQQLNHGDMVNVPAYTAIHPRISGIFAVYFTMGVIGCLLKGVD
jgi:hypothetical protein